MIPLGKKTQVFIMIQTPGLGVLTLLLSSYLPECVAASMTVSEVIKVGAATLLVFDALWFFRLVATKVATYFKPKLKPLEESRVYSICTTHDIDFNFHMNNAR